MASGQRYPFTLRNTRAAFFADNALAAPADRFSSHPRTARRLSPVAVLSPAAIVCWSPAAGRASHRKPHTWPHRALGRCSSRQVCESDVNTVHRQFQPFWSGGEQCFMLASLCKLHIGRRCPSESLTAPFGACRYCIVSLVARAPLFAPSLFSRSFHIMDARRALISVMQANI